MEEKDWAEDELRTRDGQIILDVKNANYYGNSIWVSGKDRMFFKPSEEHYYFASVEGEILYYYIAKQVGLEAVKAKPALLVAYRDHMQPEIVDGTITRDFLQDNQDQKIFFHAAKVSNSSKHTNIKSILLGIKSFVKVQQSKLKMPIIVNYEQMTQKLVSLLILDAVLYNTDRHNENLGFILERKNNVITMDLAPIYDNATIFYLNQKNLSRTLKTYVGIDDRKKFEKKLNSLDEQVYLLYKDRTKQTHYEKNLFRDIASIVINNNFANDFFKKIKNINFDIIEKEIKKDLPNFNFSSLTLKYAKWMMEHQIKNIEKEIHNPHRKGQDIKIDNIYKKERELEWDLQFILKIYALVHFHNKMAKLFTTQIWKTSKFLNKVIFHLLFTHFLKVKMLKLKHGQVFWKSFWKALKTNI